MSSLRGKPWGEPAPGPPDFDVEGGDAALAGLVPLHPGALVRYRPTAGSDFARSVGLAAGGEPTGVAVPIDALTVEPGGPAVNGVVLGTPPARLGALSPSTTLHVVVDGRVLVAGDATTVVIANGQFFDGLDVVPRGHPGDGRLEVQVYALRRGERRAMRARLPQGAHLPHPRISTASGRRVEVHASGRRLPVRIDGVGRPDVTDIVVAVVPGALRLAL